MIEWKPAFYPSLCNMQIYVTAIWNAVVAIICKPESFLCILDFIWQQYEVSWHCIRGRGYCYWNEYYGWSKLTVNTTYATVNMTRYNLAYVFEVRVLTSHGRGKASQLYYAVPEFNGMPTQFICKVTSSNADIVCHWIPPTDVNPSGFYVSSK